MNGVADTQRPPATCRSRPLKLRQGVSPSCPMRPGRGPSGRPGWHTRSEIWANPSAACSRCCKSNGWRQDRQESLGPGQGRPVIVVKGVANPACPATGPGPFLLQSGCDRARHHRPARCVPACRAGRPPRSAPPEHRHRRGDRAARRRRRPGRAPGGCAFPATAPGRTCSRGRLRTAVLITAHARTGETRHPGTLLHIGHYGVARRVAADLAIRDQGRLGGLPGLSPYVRAAPNPRALTGRFGASSHVLRSPLQAFLRFPVVCPPVLSPSSAFLWFPFGRRPLVPSLRPSLSGSVPRRFPSGFPSP